MRLLRSVVFVHPLCCAAALVYLGASAKSKVVTASEGHDGKEVTLSQSQVLEVRLVAVPGTGYGWRLSDPPPEILRLDEERLDVGGSSAPGAPATAVLRFVPVNRGSGTIRLAYVRSWEKGVPPKKTYTLRVRVR